jgi:acylphosphatase
MPEAIHGQDTIVPMSKDTSTFVYRISINNKKTADKLNISGIVEKAEKGNLMVKTEVGELQIQYFIPKNESLLIEKGSQIKITKMEDIKDASFNKLLHVEGNKGVLVSSGIITDNSPIQIIISKNLSLQQTAYNEKMILSDSEYDTHFSAPVNIVINGLKKTVEQKKELIFESNEQKYKLLIQLSSYSIPKSKYAASSEGQGYFLSYNLLMIK